VRSASPSRGAYTSTPVPSTTTLAESEDLSRQRLELQQLEGECALLSKDCQEFDGARMDSEERAVRELTMAQEVQLEELEHFRRLVADKQSGAPAPPGSRTDLSPNGSPPNTNMLLQAELEQLREHLAMVQKKGEQEQRAAEAMTEELRRETKELEQQLEEALEKKAECLKDVEEAQKGGATARAAGGNLETEKDRGEELAKEIVRSRKRIEDLDARILQLEQESKDISERASHVLQAVPDTHGGSDEPLASARAAGLQALVGDQQRQLDSARGEEDDLRRQCAAVERELESAKVEASVMEQKMKLLKSRISPPEA